MWEKVVNILGVNGSSCCGYLIMIMNVTVTPSNKTLDLFSWMTHELINLDMAYQCLKMGFLSSIMYNLLNNGL